MRAVIQNIGKIVSGDIEKGVIQGTAILVEDGKIAAIGETGDFDTEDAETVVDVNGQVVCPGFIDPHIHNTLDDYAPMRGAVGYMEDALLGGTTTLVSDGEQGPGYPRFYNDPVGVKATAILAHRVFERFRPGGHQKVHAGALVLVDGLTEEDFKEMRDAGVWLIAEIGGGGLSNPKDVAPMIGWARKYGFFVSVHLAPPSIPGSSWVKAADIMEMQPDKVAHANGGSTAVTYSDIRVLVEETDLTMELVVNGNPKMFHEIVKMLNERDELNRIVLGSDSPTGQASTPNAMHRAVVRVAALNGLPAEKAIAMATGNTADLYGLNRGKIEVGREADIIAVDCPPGSVGEDALKAIECGDMFGNSLVMVDGKVVGFRGRDSRPTSRWVRVNGVEYAVTDINEYLFFPRRYPTSTGER